MRTKANGGPKKFSNPTEFRDGVLAHEGHGRNGGKGHQLQIEFGATFSCGRVPFILEGVVGFGQDEAKEVVRNVVTEATKSIAHGAMHVLVHSNYSNAPYYEVPAVVTTIDHTTPHVVDEGDKLEPLGETLAAELAPDPRWKCARLYN